MELSRNHLSGTLYQIVSVQETICATYFDLAAWYQKVVLMFFVARYESTRKKKQNMVKHNRNC